MNKSNLDKKIKDVFIVAEYDGSYNLFGTYLITQDSGVYKVSVVNDPYTDTLEFSNLKYAVTWCVFDKNKKTKENQRVLELDSYIESLNVNIAQYKKLIHKGENDTKIVLLARLFEDKLKRKNALKEIDWYTSVSKHIQSKTYESYKDKNSQDSDKYTY